MRHLTECVTQCATFPSPKQNTRHYANVNDLMQNLLLKKVCEILHKIYRFSKIDKFMAQDFINTKLTITVRLKTM